MTPARRRLFVLLGAYEDMTERESRALRRGDIDYVLAIQERKSRLTESLQQARLTAELTADDTAALNERVRSLQIRESDNLTSLREQMAQVRQSLAEIGQAVQRSRQVRRGYSGMGTGSRGGVASVLGQA
jgi:hypothetical protein